jgi:hypothetical protein
MLTLIPISVRDARYLIAIMLVACSNAPPELEKRRPTCDEIVTDAIEIGRQTGIAEERRRRAEDALDAGWHEYVRLEMERASLEITRDALHTCPSWCATRRPDQVGYELCDCAHDGGH